MRTLTDHIVEGDACNHQVTVDVEDEPGQGGACHEYVIHWVNIHGQRTECPVHFQNGPIKEFGVNGITGEALLAIEIDRLRGFQSGQYACEDNEEVLMHCLAALAALQRRTLARIARGVEGTHQK